MNSVPVPHVTIITQGNAVNKTSNARIEKFAKVFYKLGVSNLRTR